MKITPLQAEKLITLLLGDFDATIGLADEVAYKLRDQDSDVTLNDDYILEIKGGVVTHTVRLNHRAISLARVENGEIKYRANRPCEDSLRELIFTVKNILDAPQISTALAYVGEHIGVKWIDQDGKENILVDPSELRSHVAHNLINGAELGDVRPAAVAAGIMMQRAIKLNRQLDTTMDAALGNQSEGV